MKCPLTHSPPKDAEGCVLPHDHEQIDGADVMLRGIPPQWIIPTEQGGHRITSGAFQTSSKSSDKYEGLSLGIKKMLDFCGTSIDEWAASRFRAAVSFAAHELRDEKIKVGWDPKDNDCAHCGAWGKLQKSTRRRLAKETERQFFDI